MAFTSTLLLLGVGIGLTASAASPPLCSLPQFAKCVFPSGYTGFAPFKEAVVDTMYKEMCAGGRSCVDNFVSQCLDADSKTYYVEVANATVTKVMKDVCQDGPLKTDIMKHKECWKQDKVDAAFKQCKRSHHFIAQLIKALTDRNANSLTDDSNVGHCVGYTLFYQCHMQLMQKCDLKSKDCVTGYAVNFVSNAV